VILVLGQYSIIACPEWRSRVRSEQVASAHRICWMAPSKACTRSSGARCFSSPTRNTLPYLFPYNLLFVLRGCIYSQTSFLPILSLIDSGSHRIATYFTLFYILISSNSSSSPSPIDFASAHPDTWTDGAPSNINSNTNNE